MTTPQSVLDLVQTLSKAVVYTEPTNVETNRKLWNAYAHDWDKEADFIQTMLHNLDDYEGDAETYLQLLGEEWSDKISLEVVLNEFLFPYIPPGALLAEIGSGGGRIASRVLQHDHTQLLHCFDISKNMLQVAKGNLAQFDDVTFTLLDDCCLPDVHAQSLDFVYAFDVFPHVDLHTLWTYIGQFMKVLKPGGHALIHTSHLLSPEGWKRFEKQTKYTAGGFYFVTPELVDGLATKAGFNIVKRSDTADTRSMYYQRDYLIIVQKPE